MLKNRILERTASVERLELEYYLLESEMGEHEDLELRGKKVYGIEILKRDFDSDGNEKCEVETVKNFSCCKDTTKKVLHKLAENTVTPITLNYIIDDIVVS